MILRKNDDVRAGLVVDREPTLPGPDALRGTGGRTLDPETAVSLPDRGAATARSSRGRPSTSRTGCW